MEGSEPRTLEAVVRIGDALLDQKATMTHGEFLPWLYANFEGSYAVAHFYMRVARLAHPRTLHGPQPERLFQIRPTTRD